MPDEQAPTVPAVTEVTLPESKALQIEQALRDEIAQLRREQATALAASEASLTAERLKTAREIAQSRPNEKINNGVAAVELHRAVTAVGGPAFWERLSPAEKAAALNVQGIEQTKISDNGVFT